MEQVIVGIPMYNINLNENERISLCQVLKVLKKYPICFILPEKFRNVDFFGENIRKEFFNDAFFDSVETYSALLLSNEFYKRFSMYEFLLIYQLDAFVFFDKLSEFCEMDYDYIGAPLPRFEPYWHNIKARIGNGGVSLRKIETMLRLVEKKEEICKDNPLTWAFKKWEDLFFAFCSTKPELGMRVPKVQKALTFSIENDISHCYRKLWEGLPFACHAWSKYNFYQWKPFIEKYGYHPVAPRFSTDYKETRLNHITKYLFLRIKRNCNLSRLVDACFSVLNQNSKYTIWGAGQDGQQCLSLLHIIGMYPRIYDKQLAGKYISGQLIEKPVTCELRKKKSIIIVSTRKYASDIAQYLLNIGLSERKDFIYFTELENQILYQYYRLDR